MVRILSDKIKGHENFETPKKDEIENYLKVSKKSVERMKNGLDPIKFYPKKTNSLPSYKVLAILVPILFSVIILFPLLSSNTPFFSGNGDNTSTVTDITTTSPDTSTVTTTTTEYYYHFTEWSIESKLIDLKSVIQDEMINSLTNTIYSIFKDGNESDFKLITEDEFLDLIWYLSISPDEQLKDLGYELLFKEEINPILSTNATLLIDNTSDLTIQLKTLRAFLGYSSINIQYDFQSYFVNQCISIWKSIESHFFESIGFFSLNDDNETVISINDQIIALSVLNRLVEYVEIENFSVVSVITAKLLESIKELIGIKEGVPEYFYRNNTYLTQMYRLENQVTLLLALNKLKNVGNSNLINSIILSINMDIYITNDWSYFEALSILTFNSFGDKTSFNQALVILNKASLGSLNSAKYTTEYLINKLSSISGRNSFKISDQNNSELLIDQVLIYNALKSLIQKIQGKTSADHSGQAYGIEFLSLTSILILIGFRKRKRGNKNNL